jgi:hypothetical protein
MVIRTCGEEPMEDTWVRMVFYTINIIIPTLTAILSQISRKLVKYKIIYVGQVWIRLPKH